MIYQIGFHKFEELVFTNPNGRYKCICVYIEIRAHIIKTTTDKQ